MTEALAIVFGILFVLAAGAAAWLLIDRSRLVVAAAHADEEARHCREALRREEAQRTALASELSESEKRQSEYREQLARTEADREATLRAYDEARRKMEETFNALARAELDKTAQALRVEAAAAFRQRQNTIEEMLKPVRQSLDRYTEIATQIKGLQKFGEALREETGQVVQALRGSSQVRGAWGEMLLERLLAITGLEENVHYRKQVSVTTDEGRTRPDFVVDLPDGTAIVIDSKVALDAYFALVTAKDDQQRRECMVRHARDVRKHLDSLRKKDYAALFSTTPEFVVMFLPSEAHLADAVREDTQLLEYGIQSRVIPAAPLTVWAILNGIAMSWRRDQLARNAQRIVSEASQMLERLGTMAGHIVDLQKHLNSSVEAFNAFQGSLERRVLVSARRLAELGVPMKRDMPTMTEGIEARPRPVNPEIM